MWVSPWKLRIPGGCTKIDLAARNDFLFFSVFLLLYTIEQEKDREKEKVGGRQAKLNEKNGDRDLGREIKKGGISLLEEQQENFVAAVKKNDKC